jgi:hypothetical protein
MINLSVLTFIVVVVLQLGNAPSHGTSGGASSREQDSATLKKRAEAGDVKAQVRLGIAKDI